MKKQISKLIILTLILGFGSCKKDDSSSSPTTTASVMSAKIDGVSWTSLSNQTTSSILNHASTCTGIAADSSRINFTILQNVALNGTYNIGFTSGNVATYATTSTSVVWLSNGDPTCTGTLKVTGLNPTTKRISGTFSFKGYRASDNTYKNITTGVFTNVPYQTGISNGSNTFNVKIDNVNWVPTFITGYSSIGFINVEASGLGLDKSVLLFFPDTIMAGTYSLGGPNSFNAYYSPDTISTFIATNGTLSISSHNTTTKKIIGTFNFNAVDAIGGVTTHSITNGAFNIIYN